MPSLAVQRGETLDSGNLNIFVRDRNQNFTDPYQITYAIFEQPQDILFGSPERVPAKAGVGQYYVAWTIPDDMKQGSYLVRWFIKETENSPVSIAVEQFEVVGLEYITNNPTFDIITSELIWLLRFRLRDNNPDRNYHTRPPSLEKEIAQFSKVFGFIWEDIELEAYLKMAITDINLYPPATKFTLQSFPDVYVGLLVTGAAAKAAAALVANWAADDFDYSIGGKSLNLDRVSKYEVLRSQFASEFQSVILAVKAKTRGSLYIKGLQQSFYGLSARSSLGPFTGRFVLSARSYARLGSLR